MSLPSLESEASAHFTYADLCHCSETWRLNPVENTPQEEPTYVAMARLCEKVLEPLIQAFGPLQLTYGFAGPKLARLIRRRIAPRLDQHAGHERTRTGAFICPRLGQAVDLRAPGVPTSELALFVAEQTPFDRLYFYGDDRPLHVSCGPQEARAIVAVREVGGRRMPRQITLAQLAEASQA